MEEAILIEIALLPADRSRGRHNPRAVKRKMSNFPLKRPPPPDGPPRPAAPVSVRILRA